MCGEQDARLVAGERFDRALASEVSVLIDTPKRRRRIRGLLADASRSPQIGALVSRVWSTRFELGREVIDRGVARGELRTDIPPATILAIFIGPLYVRLLITDERIDDEFIEDVIDAGINGARVAPRSPGGDGRA